MRVFINDYTKVLAYTIIGIIFAYSSFFLILNIYHYQEVRKTYNKEVNKLEDYNSIKQNIELINKNLDVNLDNYKGFEDDFDMATLQHNLLNCNDELNNTYFNNLQNKTSINIKDVEQMRSVVLNNVVNSCLIENLYYITYNRDNVNFLKNDEILLKINIDTINSEMNYINKDIMNNSGLYFYTNNTLNTIYNKPGDNFNNLLNLYKKSSDLVLTISSKFNQEVISND